MPVFWKQFWCKVLFKEFIRHFRKLNDEQIVKDIRQSMDDLEDMVADSDSFGSQMVRWSMERAEAPAAIASANNGKKGGRPRKNKADASTREGEVNPEGQQAAPKAESGTPANLIPCPLPHAAGRGATRKSGPMPDKDTVRDFALENGLDEVDAYNCWYATVNERGGCDSEGKKVGDWKAYVVAWCKTAKSHRKERNA